VKVGDESGNADHLGPVMAVFVLCSSMSTVNACNIKLLLSGIVSE
jgi:hypothetical protein